MAKELLRSKQGDLEEAIVASGTLDSLASKMNSVRLLPDATYEEFKSLTNANKKAGLLVSALRKKVDLKEDHFKKFKDILQKNKDEFEDIIDVLGIEPRQPQNIPAHSNGSFNGASQGEPQQTLQTELEMIDDSELIMDDYTEVTDEVVALAHKWRNLALKLHLDEGRINTFEANHKGDVERCLQEAIADWLKLNYPRRKYGSPSWRKLAEAVENLDGALYKKIAKNHKR